MLTPRPYWLLFFVRMCVNSCKIFKGFIPSAFPSTPLHFLFWCRAQYWIGTRWRILRWCKKYLWQRGTPKEANMLKDDVTTVNPQRSEEIDECVNNQELDWCGALVRLVGDVASVAVHGVDGHSVHAAEGADQCKEGMARVQVGRLRWKRQRRK